MRRLSCLSSIVIMIWPLRPYGVPEHLRKPFADPIARCAPTCADRRGDDATASVRLRAPWLDQTDRRRVLRSGRRIDEPVERLAVGRAAPARRTPARRPLSIPGSRHPPPVSTTPALSVRSKPARTISSWISVKISSARGCRISAMTCCDSRRGLRPPTVGTSIALVLVDQRRQRTAVLLLQPLRVGNRRAQADRQVVREVIPADGQHRGVPDRSALEAAPGRSSRRRCRSARRRGPARPADSTTRRRRAARARSRGTSMPARFAQVTRFCTEVVAAVTMCTLASSREPIEPLGRRDAALLVEDELLRQDVQDLAVLRDAHGARRVQHAPDVLARHGPVLGRTRRRHRGC